MNFLQYISLEIKNILIVLNYANEMKVNNRNLNIVDSVIIREKKIMDKQRNYMWFYIRYHKGRVPLQNPNSRNCIECNLNICTMKIRGLFYSFNLFRPERSQSILENGSWREQTFENSANYSQLETIQKGRRAGKGQVDHFYCSHCQKFHRPTDIS